MNRIDQDFTEGSTAMVKCVKNEDKLSHKVLTIKPIEQTDSFLVGTNTGFVELYKMDHGAVQQSGCFNRAPSGEVRKIESLRNELNEAVFVYVTSSGHIVVEDIRSPKNASHFSVGKERGLVSTMV
jgi:hypothetical protein